LALMALSEAKARSRAVVMRLPLNQ
jgi:hypothetical protein